MMNAIPWSFKAEESLRSRIAAWAFGGWGLIVFAIFFFAFTRRWVPPFFVLGGGMASLYLASVAKEKLGREEFVWRGVRYAGSGMLANKPRDTSRLTQWVRLRYVE